MASTALIAQDIIAPRPRDTHADSRFETQLIHGGLAPDAATGAVVTPIYQSTTFAQEGVGRDRGFTYSRTGNPTVATLESHLGAIEAALPAASFSTGMAAITALCLTLLENGDRVVISDVVYGGTTRLLRQVLGKFGVEAVSVDTADIDQTREAVRSIRPRLTFVETPANPTLKLTDIAAIAAIADDEGAILAVDNTFLTPALQRPLDLGAAVCVYSTTKYIEGHNATVGGALVTRDEALRERFKFVQNAVGFAQAPFESWLTIRGLKTLSLRLARQSESALRIAAWLEAHPRVGRISYPFLDSFPQAALARRQQRGGGGLVAFTLRGGFEASVRFLESLRLCILAENLGAVETIVTHPASMTHAEVPAEDRRRVGLDDGLIRLSVGLESPEDLLADLDQALSSAHE
ncbi:MAG: trans-sulfuration enzyme family protein [Phycisphaerales bacterium]